jgi:hypothetical protein
MTQQHIDDDGFGALVAERLERAAAPITGAGVDLDEVLARAEVRSRHRQRRRTGLAAAAAVAAILGLGAVAVAVGADDPEQVRAGEPALGPTTTTLAPTPISDADADEGDVVWAVVLDAFLVPQPGGGGTTDLHGAESRWFAAEERAAAAGYPSTLVPVACDGGATEALGVEVVPPTDHAYAVTVYFASSEAAEGASRSIEGDEDVVEVGLTCIDAPDPGTGFQRP